MFLAPWTFPPLLPHVVGVWEAHICGELQVVGLILPYQLRIQREPVDTQLPGLHLLCASYLQCLLPSLHLPLHILTSYSPPPFAPIACSLGTSCPIWQLPQACCVISLFFSFSQMLSCSLRISLIYSMFLLLPLFNPSDFVLLLHFQSGM